MAYGVTDLGFIIKPFSVIRQEIEADQRLNVHPDLDFDDEESLSQVNLSTIKQFALLWELGQAIYNSRFPDTAEGQSLVQVAAITGTAPNVYSKTVVVAQVTMNPNKALPLGSVAHLASNPSSRFRTLAEVPANAVGGTFNVTFQAETFGTIPVDVGELNTIAEPVSGWTSVTNAAAGVPGSQPETDDELRLKRVRELRLGGKGNLAAIIADVSDTSKVPGIIGVNGFENVRNYTVNGIPPKSIKIVTRGGASADIAQAILDSKAAGIDTIGTTTVPVPDAKGNLIPIRYTAGTGRAFYARIELTGSANWDSTADKADIKARVAAYVNSLDLNDNVIYGKVAAAIYGNLNVHRIDLLYIGFAPTPTGVVDLTVGVEEYAESDIANISIAVPV